MKTYGRLPIALSHGRGCWVWDTEGKKYLDALAGIAVNTLGHAHPKLVPALQDQVGKLIHSSNYYLRAAAGAARREAVRAVGPDQRLLLQLGPRGERGGAQDRAQVRPRQGHRAPRDRRLRERPSTAARSPRCRRPATPRSRPASARWSRASCACRSTTSPRSRTSARTQPERRRRVPRGDPGRRRHPADDDRLPAGGCAGSATSAAGC